MVGHLGALISCLGWLVDGGGEDWVAGSWKLISDSGTRLLLRHLFDMIPPPSMDGRFAYLLTHLLLLLDGRWVGG